MTKTDIQTTADIQMLVDSFYDRVKQDEVIGHIFKDIIGDDWSQHLPIMYRFWQAVLFGTGGYNGNPVQKHIFIDKKIPLQPEHYESWLVLWNATVDSLFTGPVADDAKKKASTMIALIKMKVETARGGKSVF